MGNRLTRIYTRTGDGGETGLADGSRVAKDAPRIEAIGAVDELNSVIGMLLADRLPRDIRSCLTGVQHDLFERGGELSVPGHEVMSDAHVRRLEGLLDRFNADAPPLRDFILPGGTRAAGCAHVARAVCRRAERRVVSLAEKESVPRQAVSYLNRLSDLLFVLARYANHLERKSEEKWVSGKRNVKET